MAFVRTDVMEERITSNIRVERISKLTATLAVTSSNQLLFTANVVPSSLILSTQMMEAIRSSNLM
jgi:hypothetical protein